MAISGIKSVFKSSSFYQSMKKTANNVGQAFYDALPNSVTGEKGDKIFKAVGREISSAENRVILGVTALMSQPFIDYHKRNIDEDTRRVAVCRTIAKIIAGTLTGFTVRKATIKGIQMCSKLPAPNVRNWQTIFTPKDVKKVDTDEFKQYQNALGTFISLGVMLFTNFLIDAPLTKFLTNTLNEKAVKNKEKSGGAK